MTEKIFWCDPYLTYLDTQVVAVSGRDVTLAQTIFFAMSGGQESDHGTIGGHVVRDARWDARTIVYRLGDDHGLETGDQVRIEIDWPRRYRLMRLHFAAEMVLELAYRHFSGIDKVGAHIAADKARIDFAWPSNIKESLAPIQRQAQAVIDRNQDIVSAFSDRDGERRYWEIPEFARVPCGGTHLRRAGEVGQIELKRRNIGKGKERIEIYVSDGPP